MWLFKRRNNKYRNVIHGVTMELDTTEGIQKTMSLGEYEPEQTSWVRQCIGKGDWFVDIGANFGWYTTLACQVVGDTGHVVAFEPSPTAFDALVKVVADNQVNNVTLERSAAGSENGEMTLYMPDDDALHSPSAFFSDPKFNKISVPRIMLDDHKLLWKAPSIKLIKIDCEGYEPNVIKGMKRLIEAGRVENMICEFNSGWLRRNNGTTPEDLQQLICSLGFERHQQTQRESHPESSDGRMFSLQDIWFRHHQSRA